MTPEALATLILAHRFRFSNERELQDGLARIFEARGLAFGREVRLGTIGTIDFLIGDVGIEVKIDGSLAALTRQLHRYAQADAIGALVVVAGRARFRGLPPAIADKPIRVIHLGDSAW